MVTYADDPLFRPPTVIDAAIKFRAPSGRPEQRKCGALNFRPIRFRFAGGLLYG